VPAAAGIPVTHRDSAHSFMVMTGSRVEEASVGEWDGARSLIEGKGTLVILMGLSRLSSIVRRLSDAGCRGDVPVAVVSKGTFKDQKTIVGTLKTIASDAGGLCSPAIIVIGVVVLERQKLSELQLFAEKDPS